MGIIRIGRPFFAQNDCSDLVRLCSEIDVDGVKEEVFVEVEAKYKEALVYERSDAFLWLVLPIAIREGYDIECDAPVSELFLHNIEQFLLPTLFKADKNAKKFRIVADTDAKRIKGQSKGGGEWQLLLLAE